MTKIRLSTTNFLLVTFLAFSAFTANAAASRLLKVKEVAALSSKVEVHSPSQNSFRILTNPSNVGICSGNNTSFSIVAGSVINYTISYQWQVSTNSGSTFNNLVNDDTYAGVTTTTLSLTNATSTLNSYQYKCVVTYTFSQPGSQNPKGTGKLNNGNTNPNIVTSNAATLTVNSPKTATVTIAAIGSYTWHGTNYTSSTTATFDTLNASGCDSLTTLYLTVYPVPGAFAYDSPYILPINVANFIPIASNTVDTTAIGYGFSAPEGVAVDAAGNVYVADANNNVVKKIAVNTGIVTTIGTGFNSPYGVAVDITGNVFVADYGNDAIKKIDTKGNITTVGSGFKTPSGVAVDTAGNVYVADYGNKAVKKVDALGNITSLGSGFSLPWSVAINNTNGNLYVTDDGNNDLEVINTVANVTVPVASFTNPGGISIDAVGNVYVADYTNGAIRKVDTLGNVSSVLTGFTSIYDVTVDAAGNIFAADSSRSQIVEILAKKYTISPTLPVGLTIDSITGIIQGTPSVLSNNTTYTVTATNSAGNNATTLDISVVAFTWTGATSTDWFDGSNWSTNQVPGFANDVVIPANAVNQPTIPIKMEGHLHPKIVIAAVKTITIDSSATLTNNSILQLYGNFSNAGSFVSNPLSSVALKDSGAISGIDTFANLEIQGNYSVGASTTDKVYVSEKVLKTSGTFTTNNKLTLLSTADASAMIQENGGTLDGKAYIQHYAGGNFGYHHFSSPVSDATVSSWSNAFPIFGEDAAPSWLSSRGSLQYYDEVKNTTSLLDSGYYNYTALSDSLLPAKGYTAWLNSLPTLKTFGTPNNGPISFPVTHTDGTNAPKGWNFVGNPYPSPISWNALKGLNTNLFGAEASCYLWKAAGKGTDGTWTTYNGTAGVNGAGDIINLSLGFFVYVDKSGTLNFDNSVRSYDYTSPEIFGTKSNATTLRLSINEPGSKVTDEAVAYTSYKASFSRKMPQPATATNPTIAFDVKGTKAAINVLTAIDSKTELPITVLTPKAGTYTLALSTKNSNQPVYLKDAVTGTYTDLSASTTITTTSKETSGRYSIVFSQPTVDRLPLTVAPNPTRDVVTVKASHIASVQVVDNLGRVIKTFSLKDATNPTLNVRGLAAGTYHLRVQTNDGKVNGANLVVSY